MAAVPAVLEAVGTAAQAAGAGKAAYDIGKRYGKGAAKVAGKIGKTALTKKGQAKFKAQAASFKKKKFMTKAKIVSKAIKGAGKAAYKGTGQALEDLDRLGDVAAHTGEALGHEGLKGASAKIKGAAQAGRQHRADAKEAYKQTKTTWANAIAEHNPSGGTD